MIKQIYEQVYDYIESDVHQRAPGESLPSEMQYSMQLAVSRLTVRKAVDELVRQGLVTRIAGKGLMVSLTPGQRFRGGCSSPASACRATATCSAACWAAWRRRAATTTTTSC